MQKLQIQDYVLPKELLGILSSSISTDSFEELLSGPTKTKSDEERKKTLMKIFHKIINLDNLSKDEFEAFEPFLEDTSIMNNYVQILLDKVSTELDKAVLQDFWEELPSIITTLSFRSRYRDIIENGASEKSFEEAFDFTGIEIQWYKLYKDKENNKYVVVSHKEWKDIFFHQVAVVDADGKENLESGYIIIDAENDGKPSVKIISIEEKEILYSWKGELMDIEIDDNYSPVSIIEDTKDGEELVLFSLREQIEIFRRKEEEGTDISFIHMWEVDNQPVVFYKEIYGEDTFRYKIYYGRYEEEVAFWKWNEIVEKIIPTWKDFLIIFSGIHSFHKNIYSAWYKGFLIKDIEAIKSIYPYPTSEGWGVFILYHKKWEDIHIDVSTWKKIAFADMVPNINDVIKGHAKITKH